jgi:Fe-S-cluster formation regulator IscX/YfhJ
MQHDGQYYRAPYVDDAYFKWPRDQPLPPGAPQFVVNEMDEFDGKLDCPLNDPSYVRYVKLSALVCSAFTKILVFDWLHGKIYEEYPYGQEHLANVEPFFVHCQWTKKAGRSNLAASHTMGWFNLKKIAESLFELLEDYQPGWKKSNDATEGAAIRNDLMAKTRHLLDEM